MIVRRACILKRKSLFKLVTLCTIVAAVLFVFQSLNMTDGVQTKWPSVRLLVSSALGERSYRVGRRDDEFGKFHGSNQGLSMTKQQQVDPLRRSRITHVKASVILEQSGIHPINKKTIFHEGNFNYGRETWQNRDYPNSNAGHFSDQTRIKVGTGDAEERHGYNIHRNEKVSGFETGSVQLSPKWKSVKLNNDISLHVIHNAKVTPSSKYDSGNRFIYKGPPLSNIRQQIQYVVGSEQKLEVSSWGQKTILLWTPFFGKTNWIQDEHFRHCDVPNWYRGTNVPPCRVISDRNELLNSDAVVMHANDLYNKVDLPEKHPIHQRWLFYCQESPKHMNLVLDDFSDTFNYTYLMRADSDYVFRHGGVVLREKPMKNKKFALQLAKIIATKKNLVATRISNCRPLERLNYIVELKKYIDVHFYGACGDRICPKGQEECNGSKMAPYKFYLAFENSKCRDYITEKFWLPLHHWNSVPVVMGGAGPEDYAKVAPPHSYINTADFDSPKDLAEYLLLLDRNRTMYKEYFHWRKTHSNRRRKDGMLCQFCADLHNASKPVQYYTDLKSWYELDSCKSSNNTTE